MEKKRELEKENMKTRRKNEEINRGTEIEDSYSFLSIFF